MNVVLIYLYQIKSLKGVEKTLFHLKFGTRRLGRRFIEVVAGNLILEVVLN